MSKIRSKLANMSREEEAEFWKTNDSTDFWDDYEVTTLIRGKRPTHKCSSCGKRVQSRHKGHNNIIKVRGTLEVPRTLVSKSVSYLNSVP